MKTITVENEKIRVTVSSEYYAKEKKNLLPWMLEQRLPSGEIRHHNADKFVRGKILSHAMQILGNQYESMILDREEFSLTEDELQEISISAVKSLHESYVEEWLNEHSKYGKNVVFKRYVANVEIRSPGIEFEIDSATAYAKAAMGEIDFMRLFSDTSEKYSEFRQRMIFKSASEGMQFSKRTVSDYVESIINFRKYMFDLEREYRHRFDNTSFVIKVLRPDLMPNQIGMCRYGS